MYFERLAARIPDQSLVARAVFLKWGNLIIGSVGLIGGVVAMTMLTPAVAPRRLLWEPEWVRGSWGRRALAQSPD